MTEAFEIPVEELPPSTFTPVAVETLDWDKTQAEMRGIELKLARIKLDWLAMITSPRMDTDFHGQEDQESAFHPCPSVAPNP